MKNRSLYRTAALFSVLLAAAGAVLACLTCTARLNELAKQAVLQHQRTLYDLENRFSQYKNEDWLTNSISLFGTAMPKEMDLASLYLRDQRQAQGDATPVFALLNADGDILYHDDTLTDLNALRMAADGAADTMRLNGQSLLLTGTFESYDDSTLTIVTAYDVSPAFAAQRAVLLGWLGLQAVLTLAALLLARHTAAMQALTDRQTRFVADLTHELKTPLTGMIGYADLLRAGELDADKRRRAADAIYRESTRLEALNRQLLALQGLNGSVELDAVPVAGAFADAVRSLPDLPCTVETDCPADAAVAAERVLLADLIRNLLLNAAHADPQDGTVRLTCIDAGQRWRLAVADIGRGIAPEHLPHLTEPFYRVDKARARADGGSGVGLALCAQIAEAFGSRLEFESEVGRGTTVTLALLKKEVPHHDEPDEEAE